jgi:hypothetical protein
MNNCEDYLLIVTNTRHNIAFLECNTKIASLYNFEKIIFLQKPLNYNICINYDLTEIDEIYMVAHLHIYNEITKLYPNVKYAFFKKVLEH